MTRARIVARGQAAAEAGMTESCVIKRPTGTASDDDGNVVTTYDPADVYDGKCKVQDADSSPISEESGSATANALRKRIDLPVSAVGPFVKGDVVFMGGVARYRVLGPHEKTWQTARRLPVEVVS